MSDQSETLDQDFERSYTMGWVDEPAQVEAVVSTLPFQSFGETPAGKHTDLDQIPEQVWGWDLYKLATGSQWPVVDQKSVGSCVSFGTANAILYTQCAEVVGGDPEEVLMPCQEVIYGGSRYEVNGGRVPFRGDGSVGAWAAKFVNQWGVLPRGIYGSYDLTTYSETRCRQYGASGVPAELETLAKKNPVQDITLVTSFDDACLALANGMGISVCSNRGFRIRRDSEGFATPSGSWAHCMAFIGYRRTGKRPGLFCVNSWGPNAHTGPTVTPDAPVSGFMVDADVAERMLQAKDSWAFSKFQGFPSKFQKVA
jgi:hypothetical protein